MIYHCTPPLNFSMCSYPGSTSMLKLWIFPLRFPLKIIPWAISHSIKNFSSDNISTGLGDKLFSSFIMILTYPSRSPIQSSGTNVITGP